MPAIGFGPGSPSSELRGGGGRQRAQRWSAVAQQQDVRHALAQLTCPKSCLTSHHLHQRSPSCTQAPHAKWPRSPSPQPPARRGAWLVPPACSLLCAACALRSPPQASSSAAPPPPLVWSAPPPRPRLQVRWGVAAPDAASTESESGCVGSLCSSGWPSAAPTDAPPGLPLLLPCSRRARRGRRGARRQPHRHPRGPHRQLRAPPGCGQPVRGAGACGWSRSC